ncbi:MAG: ATP-dependent helicase HrpB [Bacteroidales bacterium]|nr:ATP-dependent helicase HrpB [Bacteroidales bacterium]
MINFVHMREIGEVLAGCGLPAAGIADELRRAQADRGCAVVTAPPGAGKSTLLPLTILDGSGKILMLEPRRLAARQIAIRMAELIGEPAGKTVGYRIRFESVVSAATRIEILTEGILTRMLVDDPTLEGVSTIIFDEFHERSLASDTALALALEAKKLVRPDLRIVIMSATIDADGICKALGAPLIRSEGRIFPVDIIRADVEAVPGNAAEAVSHVIRTAHKEHDGDILAFLPGEAEIRRCAELLGSALGDTRICPLYGMLPQDEQRRAIAPSRPGERKVVLATPIAETSLTIEGVRVVVDSGLYRKMEFSPRSGLSGLVTERISLDMARQRSGRAGRVAPGCCYRLWSVATEARMAECRKPEILEADLASTVLDVAAWGTGDILALPWLTPPPAYQVAEAGRLLHLLGATDDDGRITARGKAMASIPCHPRIAGMLLAAGDSPSLAADIAALLEERGPVLQDGAGSCDLSARIDIMRKARSRGGNGPWSRAIKAAGQFRHLAANTALRGEEDNSPADPYAVGALLAEAYPERIGKAAGEGRGRFLMSGGDSASVPDDDPVASCDWMVAAEMNTRKGGDGRIFLAAPLNPEDIRHLMKERDNVVWDSRKGGIVAQHERMLGSLVVSANAIHGGVREQILGAICEAARKEGTGMFDFNDEVGNLQRRVAAVAAWHPELELPSLDTECVLERASEWVPAFVGNATTVAELKKVDMCEVLLSLLTYPQRQAVERLAPSHITVPTGSRIRVEYRRGAELPVLRVRLQECFGMSDTPRVDDGRKPVLMELLSPGYKSVQLTADLRSFWSGTYFEVRKELKRRYPKHAWPDDPLQAEAVRGVKKKLNL